MKLTIKFWFLALLLNVVGIIGFAQTPSPKKVTPQTPVNTSSIPYKNKLVINVENGVWGTANLNQVKFVLNSVTDELMQFLPNKALSPIIVRYDKDGPITLYKRGSNNEYIIKLDYKDKNWRRLAYQYSHELCHVIARNRKTGRTSNQWFEESLCEVASLFVLKRLSMTWASSSIQTFKSYVPSLQEFVNVRLNDPSRNLPPNSTFVEWFAENLDELQANPEIREKNAIIAKKLLLLFEQNPEGWETIGYLNMKKLNQFQSFEDYLKEWKNQVPSKHKKFIEDIAKLFDI